MKVCCAWCQKELSSCAPSDAPVSHGICAPCVKRFFARRSVPLDTFLNRFDGPVFLMDNDGRIRAANRAAGELAGEEPTAIEGKLGGDALECRYAREPGGCGQTAHCRSCTIRLCVTETLTTGRSLVRVPAFPDLHNTKAERRPAWLVSTERIGPSVLLRIEPAPKKDD
jgi:PAS domain-containing protein